MFNHLLVQTSSHVLSSPLLFGTPPWVQSMFSRRLSASGCSVFTHLLSWYHSAGMVEKRSWLLWWWQRQPLTTHFRHRFPYPRFAPSGLLQQRLSQTTEGACALPCKLKHLPLDFFQTQILWDASSLGNFRARSVHAAKLFLWGQQRETEGGLFLVPLLLCGTFPVCVTVEWLLLRGSVLVLFSGGIVVVIPGVAAVSLLNPLRVFHPVPTHSCCLSVVVFTEERFVWKQKQTLTDSREPDDCLGAQPFKPARLLLPQQRL